jgi:hypothetical protein
MQRVVFNGWADRTDPRSMTLGYSSALDAIALNRISSGLIATSIELCGSARPRRAVVTWSDVVGLVRKMLPGSCSSGLAQAVLP